MNFFVQYANDMPEFRSYIFGLTGIVLLSERIRNTDDEMDRCSKLLPHDDIYRQLVMLPIL
jgi:hypothetical protein